MTFHQPIPTPETTHLANRDAAIAKMVAGYDARQSAFEARHDTHAKRVAIGRTIAPQSWRSEEIANAYSAITRPFGGR